MKFQKVFDVNYYRYKDSAEPRRTETREWSHKYSETWAITEWHCPKCGKVEVWEEQSGGDFYVGTQLICSACTFTFHMPHGHEIGTDDADRQRLEKLTV